MASTLRISALSVRLLLLSLLSLTPTGAGADIVTWRQCKQHYAWGRVLESSLDNNATQMYLYNCHINEIRRGDFVVLPNVTAIGLGHNDIVHIDPAAFRSVTKLATLYLSYNKLSELPVFDEPSLFPSLTELDLSENQLTVIQHARTFSACVQLQELQLSSNLLEYIHPDVFKPLTALRKLYLYHNKIAYIPEKMFVSNNKLARLWLTDNRISHLPYNFVSELRNASADFEWLSVHHNLWHCACLLELLAEAGRVGVRVSYYRPGPRGTRSVCVYSGAYSCSRHAPSGLLRASPRAPASSSNSP